MSVLTSYPEIMAVEASLRPRRTVNRPMDLVGLVNRLTFGVTSAELARAQALGHHGYLEQQLNPGAIDDSVLAARLAGPEFPTLTMTPEQLALANSGDTQNQLVRARLIRAVFSRRQLFERMVDFWTDHFNIWFVDGLAANQKPWDDANVVRAHALGYFPTMLSASAHSPAMLDYLNNNTNTASAPNENYARELLELHTLGVDNGYTQRDVEEVARCFTGWTYWGRAAQTPPGQAYAFRFSAGNHDNGQKIVLGNIIAPGGGQQDGETVLRILADHPNTARFIAGKMLSHMWGEAPPESLIASVAQTYLATQGDTRAMLRVMLGVYVSTPPQPKFKRPFHLIASGLRAVGAAVATPGNLQNAMISTGHSPFNWAEPDGYPDTIEAWSGLLLPRWSFGAALMNSQYGGTTVDTNALIAGLPTPLTAAAVVGRINERLYGGRMARHEQVALTNYLLPNAPPTARVREAFGLAIGSPGFQWC